MIEENGMVDAQFFFPSILAAFINASVLGGVPAKGKGFVPTPDEVVAFAEASRTAYRLESCFTATPILENRSPVRLLHFKFYAKGQQKEFLHCYVSWSIPGSIYEFVIHDHTIKAKK